MLMIQSCGCLVGQIDALLERTAFFVGRVVLQFRQGHVQLVGEKLDRLRKGETLDVHHKLDNASARLAAKAVIDLLLPVHVERRGLFVVKRAQTNISMPVLLQLHVGADHTDDVSPLPQFFQPFLWVSSRHAIRHPLSNDSPRRRVFLPRIPQFPTFLRLAPLSGRKKSVFFPAVNNG